MIKKIEGFTGYFIDELGNVYCNLGRGNRDRSKTKELYKLNPRKARNGYLRVYMRNSETNKRVDKYIHRLVAQHFIDNPDGKDCVNHIDFDRTNNTVENLEWVTKGENNLYSMDMGRLKRDSISGRFY